MKFSGSVRMIGPIARTASRMATNRRMRGQLGRGTRRRKTGDGRGRRKALRQETGTYTSFPGHAFCGLELT